MTYLFILAAGKGNRLGCATFKSMLKIKGKRIYDYSIDKFANYKKISKIIVALPKNNFTSKKNYKNIYFITGGENRNSSFEKCIDFVKNKFVLKNNDMIFVHDSARILINKADINKLLLQSIKKKYGSLAYTQTDTVIYGDNKYKYLNKKKLYNLTTPQFIQYGVYKKQRKNYSGTDLFSYLNINLTINDLVITKNWNNKITYKEDLINIKKII